MGTFCHDHQFDILLSYFQHTPVFYLWALLNYTSWLKWLKHCVDVGFKRSIICQRFTRDSTEMKSIVFTLVGPSIWKGITEMPKSAGGSSSHAGVSSLWSGPVGNKNWKTLNNALHTHLLPHSDTTTRTFSHLYKLLCLQNYSNARLYLSLIINQRLNENDHKQIIL